MSKKPLVINMWAGPGSGKSTTAAGVFSLLKLHGVNVELITEYAKDKVWEDGQYVLNNQMYVFGKQHHRMWRTARHVDVIVTDSPLPLSVIYSEEPTKLFAHLVLETFDSFNNLNYFIRRVKPYSKVGRNQTTAEAKVLDTKIKNFLDVLGLSYQVVDGDYTGINSITLDILSELGIMCDYVILDER